MYINHRWKYEAALSRWVCAPPSKGWWESPQYCVGCGCEVTDLELRSTGFPFNWGNQYEVEILLHMIASDKGFRPIERGTVEAYMLRQKREAERTNLQTRRNMMQSREDARQITDIAQEHFFVETHRLREELWAGWARIHNTAESQEQELMKRYRLLFKLEEERLRQTIKGAKKEEQDNE